MEDDILSRAYRIGHRRMAAAFSDPLRRRLVLLFADRERSIAEVAGTTGLDLKRLHYHVTALRKLGLLKIARTQRRAGRPIKFYRAVADAFFVPEEMAPTSASSALNDELRRSLGKLRDPTRRGTIYRLGKDGQPRMQAVQEPAAGRMVAVEHWRVLRLTRKDAQRLAEEIEKCLSAFAPGDGGTKPHLVHFAMAPRVIE